MALPVSLKTALLATAYCSNPASERGFQAGPFRRRDESSSVKPQIIDRPHHHTPLAIVRSRQLGSRLS